MGQGKVAKDAHAAAEKVEKEDSPSEDQGGAVSCWLVGGALKAASGLSPHYPAPRAKCTPLETWLSATELAATACQWPCLCRDVADSRGSAVGPGATRVTRQANTHCSRERGQGSCSSFPPSHLLLTCPPCRLSGPQESLPWPIWPRKFPMP